MQLSQCQIQLAGNVNRTDQLMRVGAPTWMIDRYKSERETLIGAIHRIKRKLEYINNNSNNQDTGRKEDG